MNGRLLLADDEELFLISTAELLRAEGFDVSVARDASSATRLLAEERFDLLITDIRMPGNDNLELLNEIRALNMGIPVILVTGYPSAQTAIQALGHRVFSYLVKPLAFADLVIQVREGVRQHRVQQNIQAASSRASDWARELGALTMGLDTSGQGTALPVNQVLGAVLGHMGETLLDLKHLVDLTMAQDGGATCSVRSCPRMAQYEAALSEGIRVLERTKGSFKSKELGELRHCFERVSTSFGSKGASDFSRTGA
ncbi:MAG: hypothetical protein H6Q00_1148 [Holophagaceae bacterium]|nr:hypothetical protein [Holophagaceae bacterium]